MVGGVAPRQAGPAERVDGALRAAAYDLIVQLSRQPLVERIILVSPDSAGLMPAGVTDYVQSAAGDAPQIGETLSGLVDRYSLSNLLYFGGGSAPLLTDEGLVEALIALENAQELVITNNRFASDWAGVRPATHIQRWMARLPRDNMLGWVLSTEASLPVRAFPPSAASRLDIDTPTDLLTLSIHPATKPQLRGYLASLDLDTGRLRQVLQALARPAARVFIAGRIGPEAWAAVNRISQCWLRVIAEERGMVSSGREQRGEARSLLAEYIEVAGMEAFFGLLADWADAALIDTRVLLAHHRRSPDRRSRFASDLGVPAEVEDEWLRQFTEQALACRIPIVLGGHGLLSGDLLAYCDVLASWQSDR
jgi:CTP:molybdopterin cytidylyltransferase MocA